MLSNFDKTFRKMQLMSDRIRRDVEETLNRSFNTWDLLDFSLPLDEKNDYYRMKIRTDDNGHVKVKTIEKEPGKPEKVHVEEYDKGSKALEQQQRAENKEQPKSDMISIEKDKNDQLKTTSEGGETREVSELADFEKSFKKMQEIADHIREDVESRLGMPFTTWNLLDYSFPIDPEKSYVRMKIKTDDNGHVRVKTAKKEPGKPWDVNIEEYNRGDKGMSIEEGNTESRSRGIGQGSETMEAKRKNIENVVTSTADQA